jgi:hypothetical protein
MVKWIAIGGMAALLTMAPAWGQDDQQEGGAGVITIDEWATNISNCITKFEGLVVLYVLPKGWEAGEQGVDPQTGKLNEDLNRYVLLSRSLRKDADGVPELLFELSIYREVLPEAWDEGLSVKEKSEMEQAAFWDFIDAQMGVNARTGWRCITPTAEIKAEPYGTGARPATYFVPIEYEREGKVNLYTFTTVTAGKVWTIKFLVEADKGKNYGALITYILNNSFAMSEEQFDQYQEQYGLATEPGPAE